MGVSEHNLNMNFYSHLVRVGKTYYVYLPAKILSRILETARLDRERLDELIVDDRVIVKVKIEKLVVVGDE